MAPVVVPASPALLVPAALSDSRAILAPRSEAGGVIVAGFDEAGYGPRLGPLVLAWTAFRVPDATWDRCLWKELSAAVRDRCNGAKSKLWIADSKEIKPRTDGLKHLE